MKQSEMPSQNTLMKALRTAIFYDFLHGKSMVQVAFKWEVRYMLVEEIIREVALSREGP